MCSAQTKFLLRKVNSDLQTQKFNKNLGRFYYRTQELHLYNAELSNIHAVSLIYGDSMTKVNLNRHNYLAKKNSRTFSLSQRKQNPCHTSVARVNHVRKLHECAEVLICYYRHLAAKNLTEW